MLVPLAMGFDLAQGWAHYLKKEVEAWGGTFETRDPNWVVDAGAQAITDAISSDTRPDVLIIHAPDLNSYSKLMKKAQAAGTYVLLVDNPANFPADAFVGSDWDRLGQLEAEAAIKGCGENSSKKIGLVQGDQANSSSLYQYAGIMTVVMLGGGIDLSVGSIFALSCFSAVYVFFILEQSIWLAMAASLATGLIFGAINGYLVGYLRLRAFLTTLVTFIFGRALFDILVTTYAADVQLSTATSDVLDFIGDSTFWGLSVSVWLAIILAIVTHIALTRSRPGWHGEIVRFFAPDYVKSEVFAHIGGFPLGLAFDKTGNLISCVGAMRRRNGRPI